MLLGCIADDLTGATDLSLMLSRAGFRTLQTVGIPDGRLDLDEFDAVVVGLKSRTCPVAEAVATSIAATQWLHAAGARRFYFKYCSTFDSTDRGNIGPVIEALMLQLSADFTIACPAFPAAGRSVYMGNLFVQDVPLAESSMRDHPLTPMRDSDLRRVLGRQVRRSVGHIAYSDIEGGADRIRSAIDRERREGRSIAIVDALNEVHLRSIGSAVADLALVTGGSGLGAGLPEAYRERGLIKELHTPPSVVLAPAGRSAILAGSCSSATRAQVRTAIELGMPSLRINPLDVASGAMTSGSIVDWLVSQPEGCIPLVYSSDEPSAVLAVQEELGREDSGHLIENVLGEVAAALPERGFTRLIVAGGETSGAVVNALRVKVLSIGPEIDPGVPWTLSRSGPDMALALKSGNFGSRDFFHKAWDLLK